MPYIFLLLGFGLLIKGADLLVDGAVHMALSLGMSEVFGGLTIVAVGTSLPDLATSAMAACKKNVEIAVGNVVGSNIFNIFFVLGLSSIVKPLPFQTKNNTDVGMVMLASLLLFVYTFTGKKRSLDRWEGAIFIGLYVCYIIFLIIRG